MTEAPPTHAMTMGPGEVVVMVSDGDVLTLTNKRVRYNLVARGRSKLVSMTLDAVSSCSIMSVSRPGLLILGALMLLAGLMAPILGGRGDARSVAVVLFTAGVGFLVGYLLLRFKALKISSDGGDVILTVSRGMDRRSLVEFVDALEFEKAKYCGRSNPVRLESEPGS